MEYLLIFLFYLIFCAGVFFLARRIKGQRILVNLNKDFDIQQGFPKPKVPVLFINEIAKKIGSIFQRISTGSYRKKYESLIDSIIVADSSALDFSTLLGYKILAGLAAGIFISVILKKIYLLVPGFFCFSIAGFFIPDILLKRFIKVRHGEFESDLPYVMDLLYIATLSGQNIFNSIKILTEKYKGSIAAELGRFLKEINFGIGRVEAYRHAVSRSNVDSLRNLLMLLVQAEKYGSRISEVLKQKSKYLRFELAQKHEIRSRRISILLLFPLVFLILPAFVLLVGGPLVFSIGGSFIFPGF